jgi:hypothetical protein
MSRVEQMQEEIAKLSRKEFGKLANWIVEERNRRWDQQLEEDSASGALDFLLAEVEGEISKGRTLPTVQVIAKKMIS